MTSALQIATTFEPYVRSQPAAVLVWVTVNLLSLGFEGRQWLQRRSEATNNDDGSLGLLLTGTAVGLALLILSERIAPWAEIEPAWVAFAGGLTIYLAGFGMRRWSEMTLGRYFTFTVMTSAGQPVVTTGPYRYVRHPGYTGVVLVVVGAGVVTGNWVGLVGWTLLVVLPLLYRIHVEEDALLAELGDIYRDYATHHKRLIPLVW